MNSLSLLIYGISTLLQFTTFLIVAIGAVAIIFAFSMMFIIFAHDEYSSVKKSTGETAAKYAKRSFVAAALFAFLLVFLPSEKFLVLIAASEVGEMALKQPAVQNAMGAIGGLSSDATNLLKLYIENETEKLVDEMKPKEKTNN
jgi:cobalamin synthase